MTIFDYTLMGLWLFLTFVLIVNMSSIPDVVLHTGKFSLPKIYNLIWIIPLVIIYRKFG